MSLKASVRSLFPRLYHALWVAKKYLRERAFRNPWLHYYDGKFKEPEQWLYDIQIPSYIDTILDVGCGNGRNFVPFDGKLVLWGVDIVPESRITWARNFQNLRYEQKTLEELTRQFEREPADLARTLVFTSGTMMYASRKWQERFYNACKMCGGRNFIFHEHPTTSRKHPIENFKLPPDWFEVKKMRKGESDVLAFMHLEE